MQSLSLQHRISFIVLLIALPLSVRGAVILQEDFETDGAGIRYTVTGGFSNGVDDYFTRVKLDNAPTALPAYAGFSGTWFWAAEDTDGPGNPDGASGSLLFSGVELLGNNSITFSLLVGAGSQSAYDRADDYLHVQYRFGADAWQTALAFENDGATYNSALRQDTNFDGTGDGPIVGLALQPFTSQPIAAAADSVDIRIVVLMNAGGETVAFDNLVVSAVPEPADFALLAGILCCAGLFLRRTFQRLPPYA
jgi:hypothetical protein